MRIAAFDDTGTRRHGLVVDDQVHPLPTGIDLFAVLDDIDDEERMLAACSAPVPLAAVRLLAPVQPPTVRDFVTFEEHIEGVRRSVDGTSGVPEQWYAAPTFYFTNAYSILGPADEVPVPPGCAAFDFELEVAAVIGRPGRDLTPEQARDHIVGYTIFNDWSARDLQRAEMRVGLGPAKGKDTRHHARPVAGHRRRAGAVPRRATGSSTSNSPPLVNGKRVGHDRLSNMGWTFEDMVAYASRGTWVRPGDVLGVRHLRQRRLPCRALGPQRRTDPTALAARRRRHPHRRGHRRTPQYRRTGRAAGARSSRPSPARGPPETTT